MTAAQRLRLVVALGVVNLVLAGVALGFGIVGLPASNPIGAVPTPPTAIALPAPTPAPTRPSPRPTPTPPADEPPASTPPGSPTPTPTPTPPPPVQPTATPPTVAPQAPEAAGTGGGGIAVVVAHPAGGTPPPSPTPVVPSGPPACAAVPGHRPPGDPPDPSAAVGLARLAEACPPPGIIKHPKAVKPPTTHERPPQAHGPKAGQGHHTPATRPHTAKRGGAHRVANRSGHH
ncbi:MAG TPA: hypothetical protein VGQ31_01780 [Candidatus Limnocylindrales bacterium]|nr:hypothetical protein [Candidatus Limnocylindrales bacterium]